MTAKPPPVDLPAIRAAVEEAAATTRPLSVAKAHALAEHAMALLEPAEARAATLAGSTLGRPVSKPKTALERLIADACKAQRVALNRPSYGKADLADAIGMGRQNGTLLSPAKLRERGMEPTFEQAIRALIAPPK